MLAYSKPTHLLILVQAIGSFPLLNHMEMTVSDQSSVMKLAVVYNSISFENFLGKGFKILSLNDVVSFIAQLWCIKVSAMCQA
mgnify:CR=1 FL=1